MTKMMFKLTNKHVYLDCINHSEDRDVCTIISTLLNVLCAECLRWGKEIKIYEPGHVLIDTDLSKASLEVFIAVSEVLKEVEKQHPKHFILY